MKILVIDDEKPVRDILVMTLQTLGGHVVLEADNGAKWIEVLQQYPDIDLAIFDLEMPGATGFEVLQHMVESGHPARRILMSAKMTPDMEEEARAKGAECGIYKPYLIKILSTMGLIGK